VRKLNQINNRVWGGAIFSREETIHECDWIVMSSVFAAGQSGCFIPVLFSRVTKTFFGHEI
jgi:hypothetical protein